MYLKLHIWGISWCTTATLSYCSWVPYSNALFNHCYTSVHAVKRLTYLRWDKLISKASFFGSCLNLTSRGMLRRQHWWRRCRLRCEWPASMLRSAHSTGVTHLRSGGAVAHRWCTTTTSTMHINDTNSLMIAQITCLIMSQTLTPTAALLINTNCTWNVQYSPL